MPRLPIPGLDNGTWGDILNQYLLVEHKQDGILKNVLRPDQLAKANGIATLGNDGIVPSGQLPAAVAPPDADATTKGLLQLTGDLGGAADNPKVVKLQNRAVSSLTPSNGEVLTYDSGSNSWQPQDIPVTQDATTTQKGIVQLTGDFGGSATSPTVPTKVSKAGDTMTGGLIVSPVDPSAKPLIVKAAPSQSADMQQWQSSNGAPFAIINSTGSIRTTSGVHAGDTGLDALTGTTAIVSADASGLGAGYVPFIARAAASQIADLQQWQDSAGTVLSRISNVGTLFFKGSFLSAYDGRIGVTAELPASVVATFKGAASQTANLTEWQFSNATTQTAINSSGSYRSKSGVHAGLADLTAPPSSAIISSTSLSTNNVPFIARGISGQTADLQQWQDSSGTVLSYINSFGSLVTTGSIVSGSATATNGVMQALFQVSGATSRIGVVVRGIAGQAANLEEWQTSTGAVLGRVEADGRLSFGPSTPGINGKSVTVGLQSRAANLGVLSVRGFSGQSEDLQQWQDSNGTMLARLDQLGGFSVASGSGISGLNGRVVVNLTSASAIGVAVKGTASQTADLQQWQNSAGTVLARVAANGDMYVGSTQVGGANIVTIDTVQTIIGQKTFSTVAVGTPNVIVKAIASQTTDLQQWQDSSGAIRAAINPFGQLAMGANQPTLSNARVTISTVGTTSEGIIIRGVASQTADLQQWQDSGGVIRARVSSAGVMNVVRMGIGTGTYDPGVIPAILRVDAATATSVGIITRAAASQTVNLQEWQDNTGAVLTSVSASGSIVTTKNASFGQGATFTTPSGGNAVRAEANSSLRVPLMVRGFTAQTANLQEWQNVSGVSVAKVTATGKIDTTDEIELTTASKGVVLSSPNGTRYRIAVTDAGALTVTAA